MCTQNLIRFLFYFLILIIFLGSTICNASPTELYPFKDPHSQQRFQTLNKNLRCLVCQNQDLADSHAPLAEDLRQQIYQQIQQGNTDQQIINYLTTRYGDFILFKPPMNGITYFLWLAPGLFVLLGIGLLMKNIFIRHA